MPAMPTDDSDDPGADTAMFRAYVDSHTEPALPGNRTVIIALVAAIVVLALIAIVVLVS
jgi:hypothetical protein